VDVAARQVVGLFNFRFSYEHLAGRNRISLSPPFFPFGEESLIFILILILNLNPLRGFKPLPLHLIAFAFHVVSKAREHAADRFEVIVKRCEIFGLESESWNEIQDGYAFEN